MRAAAPAGVVEVEAVAVGVVEEVVAAGSAPQAVAVVEEAAAEAVVGPRSAMGPAVLSVAPAWPWVAPHSRAPGPSG